MSKLVLILNCGSSSLKFAVVNSSDGESSLTGLAECLFQSQASIKWQSENNKYTAPLPEGAGHEKALEYIVDVVLAENPELAEQITAIGHRVVHGGEYFTESVLIDETVLKHIEDCATLAPLHNPANVLGIRAAQKAFPSMKNIAVFDTAFHQTMPEEAYLYALPYSLYKKHGIRRYGMHGTSHRYITRQAAKQLNKTENEVNIISCHLGNGASICAVKNGQSIDTSMGLTPLEGLVMGTRCGDIDPAVIFHLHDVMGYSISQINTMMTKESGILGLTEKTPDCRYVTENYGQLNDATRALNSMCHRLAKYIAGYATEFDQKIDAIVFSGGIGENAALVRTQVLKRLAILGIKIDESANTEMSGGLEGRITLLESVIPALVIPTDEELLIAEDTASLADIYRNTKVEE